MRHIKWHNLKYVGGAVINPFDGSVKILPECRGEMADYVSIDGKFAGLVVGRDGDRIEVLTGDT